MSFFYRIVESNLLTAYYHLVCDDPTSCNLALAEVENILGANICLRKKENMKRQAKKATTVNARIATTSEIILRDWNENDDLGASPSLPRPLYELPNWIEHAWTKCNCLPCNSNPSVLTMMVYKFFTYHGAALDMNEGENILPQ